MQIYPSCLHILPKYIVQHNHLPTHLPLTLAHLSITIHVTTPQIMQSRVIFKSSFLRISHPKGRHKPPLLSSITLVVRKLLPPFGFCTVAVGACPITIFRNLLSLNTVYGQIGKQSSCPLSFLIFYIFCFERVGCKN